MEKIRGIIATLDSDLAKYDSILNSISHYRKTKEIMDRTYTAMGRRTSVDFSKTQVTNIKANVKSASTGTTGSKTKI